MVSFSKYSGCGNDFILIDNRALFFDPNKVSLLCDRRQGIGADGVVLLERSAAADHKMRIFNADGSEAEMCGNGIRCLMQFIQDTIAPHERCNIETMLRNLTVAMDGDHVKVDMGDPLHMEWSIPLEGYTWEQINTGVPHAVTFVQDLDGFPLEKVGPTIRRHPYFGPNGTNVNIATINDDGTVSVRTYERGVEGETLACGTGATATAIAASKKFGLKSPVSVKVRSNDLLKIGFEWNSDHISRVTLTGPAQKIFSGVTLF